MQVGSYHVQVGNCLRALDYLFSMAQFSRALLSSVPLQGSLIPIVFNFQNSSRWGCILLVILSPSFEKASNCVEIPVKFVSMIKFLLINLLVFVLPVRIHPILNRKRRSVSVISICFMDTISL